LVLQFIVAPLAVKPDDVIDVMMSSGELVPPPVPPVLQATPAMSAQPQIETKRKRQ